MDAKNLVILNFLEKYQKGSFIFKRSRESIFLVGSLHVTYRDRRDGQWFLYKTGMYLLFSLLIKEVSIILAHV